LDESFLTKLGVVPLMNELVALLCDNKQTIAQAKEPRSHQKTKHYCRNITFLDNLLNVEMLSYKR